MINFGELAGKHKFTAENNELEYLFENSRLRLKDFDIDEAERRIAMEQLRKLTAQLQTRRLRHKTKSACKYFTL